MIQSTSAGQAKEYFNDSLHQSGYYLNDQEYQGLFAGRVATRLGIGGLATKNAFHALCENINPATGNSLPPRKTDNRTVGYDINFDCPKSVSILHALANDSHILDAFQASVQQTMLDIEKDAQTRVRKDGKDEDRLTGEMVWADFIHQTARPVGGVVPDPHLHCHSFVFNVTWDQVEGEFKAGQFRDIKRDMPYYQSRFHKILSDKLIGLGYRIRRTGTAFEIAGVPERIIDLFSKRTDEIGRIAKELGITNQAELDQLGARTRAKKQKGLTMTQLKQEWRKQIFGLGMTDKDEEDQPIRYAPVKEIPAPSPKDCVDHALTLRFERASVMQDRRILETAYRHSIGHSSVQVDQITESFARDKRILKIKDGSKTFCTTKEVLAEERRMVRLARTGTGLLQPLCKVAPQMALDGEQAEAIRHVLTTTNRVSIIRGRAGTGKTTLMQEAIHLIEQTGRNVTVVAPTAQAARGVLRDEGFAEAETVAKLLSSTDLQNNLLDGVLWVDEAGLLNTTHMTALLRLVIQKNARLILSGDTRQHASVVRGDALRILNTIAGIAPAEVSRIFWQRNLDYRKAVQALSENKIVDALATLNKMGAIKTLGAVSPFAGLATDYVAALKQGKTALVKSPTHQQGELVTQAVRDQLRQAGKIAENEAPALQLVNSNMTLAEKSDGRNYKTGQIIQFSQNVPGIERGSRWSVASVNDAQIIIKDSRGNQTTLPLDTVKQFDVYWQAENKNGTMRFRNTISKTNYTLPSSFGHLAYSHCVTSHAAQGKTVDEVFIAQPVAAFAATNLNQFYVSISRARDGVHIYTDDPAALLVNASGLGDRLSALELVQRKKTDRKTAEHLVRTKPPVTTTIKTRREPDAVAKTVQRKPKPHAPRPTL